MTVQDANYINETAQQLCDLQLACVHCQEENGGKLGACVSDCYMEEIILLSTGYYTVTPTSLALFNSQRYR